MLVVLVCTSIIKPLHSKLIDGVKNNFTRIDTE